MIGSVWRMKAVGSGCHHAAAVGTSCRFTGSLAPAKPVITIPVKVRKVIQDKSVHQSTRFEIQKTLCGSDGSGTGLTGISRDKHSGNATITVPSSRVTYSTPVLFVSLVILVYGWNPGLDTSGPVPAEITL
jgi:hypothetical protein